MFTNMSAPRGKRIHRLMHGIVRERLEGTDMRGRIDFSKRGGHQSMVILRGEEEVFRIPMVSTPRDETTALRYFRERLDRELSGREEAA
jgi:hypothetical protein